MPKLCASSVSLVQFVVTGESLDTADFMERLRGCQFHHIDSTTDEVATGWVQADDTDKGSFKHEDCAVVGDYRVFSLRQDVRKIPGAVLKQAVKKEEDKWKGQHPEVKRVPKGAREEIKEKVTARLLGKVLPAPTVFDIVWDTRNHLVSVFTNSSKSLDLFNDFFRKTFTGFSLQLITPYRRCQVATGSDDSLHSLVEEANQAGSDSILSIIKDNLWIGQDFIMWLLAARACGNKNLPKFSAWIDKKIGLAGDDGEGIQKVTVGGPIGEKMPTVKTALADNKKPVCATVHIETETGDTYSFTLDGEKFSFSGFKTPKVILDGDADDATSEYQAIVLEKMSLIEKGTGYLGDMLKEFLVERLSKGEQWNKIVADLIGE